jgi:hypothetical protein
MDYGRKRWRAHAPPNQACNAPMQDNSMKNFVLIDHSVKRIGGHNFEYAYHILQAAESQGFRPVFCVNRRFFERKRLPATWTVLPIFQHTTYEVHHLQEKESRLRLDDCDGGASTNGQRSWRDLTWLLPRSWKRRLANRYRRMQHEIVAQFSHDISAAFSSLRPAEGDLIFVPTLSREDLVGLVEFFRSEPRAGDVDWHLQFHFRAYEGREPDYQAQDKNLGELKRLFETAASVIPPGRGHFYATTEHLANQYNRLSLVQFEALPYPVNPALLEAKVPATSGRPLRVTCAGGVRPEKGTAQLYRAIAPLWNDYFETGRLQLVVQAKRLGKLPIELRPHARWDSTSTLRAAGDEDGTKVAAVRWPLSTEAYLDLVRRSHIGLLLYDADQYYVRCSGVMVEMLKAGVPVVVPAGCWMADQIAESIYAHRDAICERLQNLATLTASAATWKNGAGRRIHAMHADESFKFSGGDETLVSQIRMPPGATHVCIRFRFGARTERGEYAELIATQTSDGKRQVSSRREILGQRACAQPISMLIPLVAQTRLLQTVWRNGYGMRAIDIRNVEFVFLKATGSSCPLGAVGLISAGIDQAADLVRDIADHYDHYRQTAVAFSTAWGEWHCPQKVVRLLTERSADDRQRTIRLRLPKAA